MHASDKNPIFLNMLFIFFSLRRSLNWMWLCFRPENLAQPSSLCEMLSIFFVWLHFFSLRRTLVWSTNRFFFRSFNIIQLFDTDLIKLRTTAGPFFLSFFCFSFSLIGVLCLLFYFPFSFLHCSDINAVEDVHVLLAMFWCVSTSVCVCVCGKDDQCDEHVAKLCIRYQWIFILWFIVHAWLPDWMSANGWERFGHIGWLDSFSFYTTLSVKSTVDSGIAGVKANGLNANYYTICIKRFLFFLRIFEIHNSSSFLHVVVCVCSLFYAWWCECVLNI